MSTEDSGWTAQGNWGPDHHISGMDDAFLFAGTDDDTILRLNDAFSSVDSWELEEDWEGTGQIVFDSHVFYVELDTGQIVKYDLIGETEVARASLGSIGTGHDFDYAWGGYTSVDLATDGDKLYAIHSSDGAGGALQVSRIHPGTLSILSTRTSPSSALKSDYSSGFMACGVLYAVDNFYADTTINYAWQFDAGIEWDPAVAWSVEGYLSSSQYSSKHDTVYVYDAGTLMTAVPEWGP
jgi:hypothetical protein